MSEREQRLELALRFILVGVLNKNIKSAPIMPPFDENAETIDMVSLSDYIENVLKP